MRKKIAYIAGIVALAGSLMTGCGKKEEATTTEATTTEVTTEATTEEVTEATPEDAEEELESIGKEDAKAYKIKLTNSLGQDVTAIYTKLVDDEEWSDNMLADDAVFADKEKRYFFQSVDAEDKDAEYELKLVLADESEVILHAFPYSDMQEAELCVEDEVVYFTYLSAKDQKELKTLDAELEIKAQEEAEAAAAAAAQQQAAPATTPSPAPAPAPEPAPEPAGDDDCLGDGLTY